MNLNSSDGNRLRVTRIAMLLAIVATVAMAVFTSTSNAVAAVKRAKLPNTVRLYVFDCGRLKVADPVRFNFKKEELAVLDLSVPCFMIVHPKGVVMWDVGVIPDSLFKPDGSPATKEYATSTKPLQRQMAEAGFTPADVKYLILSHVHWDHVANVSLFAQSTWLVRKVERDIMFQSPPERTDPSMFEPMRNTKTVLIDIDEYDVFGDGTVIIKSSPGHTPGHQCLLVKLAHTGPVLLSGDLYHYPEELKVPRVPVGDFNKEQTLASRAAIQSFLKQTGAQLWIQHDLAAFEKLKKSPGFYD